MKMMITKTTMMIGKMKMITKKRRLACSSCARTSARCLIYLIGFKTFIVIDPHFLHACIHYIGRRR